MSSLMWKCRLVGSMLIAEIMMAGIASAQSSPTQVAPPLSHPLSQYLRSNPDALEDLMSRQVPPSTEPGPRPQPGPLPVPTEQPPAKQTAPASPWQQLSNP